MKVIIAGSRRFTDYEYLKSTVDWLLEKSKDIEIFSGGAIGADVLGEKYAKERGYPIKSFPANWSKHGKSAGPIRNKEMADGANLLIAFYDGKSRGTKNMIKQAFANKIPVYDCRYLEDRVCIITNIGVFGTMKAQVFKDDPFNK